MPLLTCSLFFVSPQPTTYKDFCKHFCSSSSYHPLLLLPFHYDMLRVTAILLHRAANKHIVFHQDPAQWLQWHYW